MSIETRKAWLYAVGCAIEGSMGSILAFYINPFLLGMGISGDRVALLLFVGKILDAVNDPLVGMIGDGTVSRFGRRRFWMSIALIPLCVSYVLMWVVSPWGISEFWWFMLVYFIFDVSMSFYKINYDALTSEMTSNHDEMIPLVFKRTLVYVVSSGLAVVIQSVFVSGEMGSATAFFRVGIAVALVGIGTAAICIYHAPSDPVVRVQSLVYTRLESFTGDDGITGWTVSRSPPAAPSFADDVRRSYRSMLDNPSYICLCISNMCVWSVLNMIQAMLRLYVRYVRKQSDAEFTWVILRVQLGVFTGLFLFMGLHVAGFLHDKRRALWIVIKSLVVVSLGLILPKDMAVVDFSFGVCVSGAGLLFQSMLPDTIALTNSTHASNGVTGRVDGSYYAFFSVLQKLSSGAVIGGVNLLLHAHGFLSGDVDEQPSGAVNALRLVFVIFPPIMFSLSAVPLYFYSISRSTQASVG